MSESSHCMEIQSKLLQHTCKWSTEDINNHQHEVLHIPNGVNKSVNPSTLWHSSNIPKFFFFFPPPQKVSSSHSSLTNADLCQTRIPIAPKRTAETYTTAKKQDILNVRQAGRKKIAGATKRLDEDLWSQRASRARRIDANEAPLVVLWCTTKKN